MSSKDLVIQKLSNSPLVKKEYKQMLTNINATLPAIKQSSSNFYKSHSQFMGVMLDVTAITPIRSVKHTLAELDKGATFDLAVVKSPKSVALPVLATVT